MEEEEDNKLRKPLFAGLFPGVVVPAAAPMLFHSLGIIFTYVQWLQAPFYVMRVWLYYWLRHQFGKQDRKCHSGIVSHGDMRGRKV